MNDSLLVGSASDHSDASWHDRVQIALAIADTDLLRSLLVNCTPPITHGHRIGGVQSTIGVPVTAEITVDGVIDFEEVQCVLANSPQQLEQDIAEYTRLNGNQRGYLDLTRCETEMQILGQKMPLSQAISVLSYAGFVADEIEAILNLSFDACHKSWWYEVDETGAFTIPFLRVLRTRRFADGTFLLQYKDFFAQAQPPCFKSQHRQVLVEVLPEPHQFQTALAKINQSRQQTGIAQALLICNQISDLEARGFISQGISLYAAHEITLPVKANCHNCATRDCPMCGRADSPVLLCQRFCLEGE